MNSTSSTHQSNHVAEKILNHVERRGMLWSLSLLFVVTVLSLYPADELPPFPGTDKAHHFIAYAAVMLPMTLATLLKYPRYWWCFGVLIIAYSGVIELLQPHVNRYGEWLDLAANSGGVLLGAILAVVFRRRFGRRSR